ncbi:hypothetical protein D3C84_912830 [compost metagenome]
MLTGLRQRYVASRFPNRYHQLYLVVIIIGLIRVAQFKDLSVLYGHHGVSWFQKEERWLALRIKAHFSSMCCVVAPHAVHATHRKSVIAPIYI